MRRPFVASLLLTVLAVLATAAFVRSLAPGAALAQQGTPQTQQPPQGMPPGGMPPGGPVGPQGMQGPPPPFDTSMAHAKQEVDEWLAKLGPKADAPAESVFKNIQIFKGQPAKVVVKSMVYGFSHGLGARCGKCHVRGDMASDDRPDKKTAREMWKMMTDINTQYLAKMKLEDDMPTVMCWTCHRGRSKPDEFILP